MVLTRDEKQPATAINIKRFYDLCNIEIKYFDTMNRSKGIIFGTELLTEGVEAQKKKNQQTKEY
jgi:hypothetical protein